MTINEMFNELEDKARDTYIVTLKYKYDFEENYTIENQILVYDSKADSYVWQNDWNEGQTDVEVLGYMLLGDVDTTKLEPCEDWYDVPSDEMTFEQARQAVKDLRKKLAEYLEQQPCEDCISREAVEKITWEEPSYDDALNVLTEVRDKVKALPPVKPQRPKGKWIFHKPFDDGCKNCNECVECSQCHIWLGYDCYAKTLYCPNCGAEMEG